MKVLEEKYPKGTIGKLQRTDGRYIDGYLYDNMKILAETIVNDMTFLVFIFSSTLEVGAGKSTLASQLGEIWTDLVNKLHGTKLEFNMNNCVFKPRDLIERSFKLPEYSFIWLDEWEDLHYMSELGMSLRQFFRKCRQLNLFIVCIIPNFFQLPMPYAISRSVCAIDVYYKGRFERGNFKFYNFEQKKWLYIKGKKNNDYSSANPSFCGSFLNGYGVNEKEYRDAKLRDTLESEKKGRPKLPPRELLEFNKQRFRELYDGMEKGFGKVKAMEMLSKAFKITSKTGYAWLKENKNDVVKDIL